MFFFPGSRKRRLLGFLHAPAGKQASVGLVYCHPFTEEKLLSHAISVKTARRIASLGVPVMRFDLSGCGDSEGELTEVNLDDWMEDLRCAADLLAERTGVARVALWGLRLGANLSLRYASLRPVAFLILWQPLPDLEQYFRQFLRQKLSTELAAQRETKLSLAGMITRLEAGEILEVAGYPVANALYRSFVEKAKTPRPEREGVPALFATISMAEEALPGPQKLAESLKELGYALRAVHIREEPFWDQYWRWDAPALARATAEYVEAAL